MLTMELTDILVLAMLVPMVPMVPMVLAMLDMLLPMPMVPTTERGPLMLSPRLMPTMEFTAMVLAMDTAIPAPTPMVLMLTASKCHRLQFNCLTYCEPKAQQ